MRLSCSKLESSFARRFRERLDTTVVEVTGAIEDAGLDPSFARARCQALSDLDCLSGLVALEALRQARPDRRGERASALVIHELRRDAPIGAEDNQARPLGRAGDLPAHAPMAAHTGFAVAEATTHALLPTFRRTYSPT